MVGVQQKEVRLPHNFVIGVVRVFVSCDRATLAHTIDRSWPVSRPVDVE
jgi:hypothetical protein